MCIFAQACFLSVSLSLGTKFALIMCYFYSVFLVFPVFQGGPGIRGARGDRGEPGVTVSKTHFSSEMFYPSAESPEVSDSIHLASFTWLSNYVAACFLEQEAAPQELMVKRDSDRISPGKSMNCWS